MLTVEINAAELSAKTREMSTDRRHFRFRTISFAYFVSMTFEIPSSFAALDWRVSRLFGTVLGNARPPRVDGQSSGILPYALVIRRRFIYDDRTYCL